MAVINVSSLSSHFLFTTKQVNKNSLMFVDASGGIDGQLRELRNINIQDDGSTLYAPFVVKGRVCSVSFLLSNEFFFEIIPIRRMFEWRPRSCSAERRPTNVHQGMLILFP